MRTTARETADFEETTVTMDLGKDLAKETDTEIAGTEEGTKIKTAVISKMANQKLKSKWLQSKTYPEKMMTKRRKKKT